MAGYVSHFDLNEAPFGLRPDPRFLFWTAGHRLAAGGMLRSAGEAPRSSVVIGTRGAGKTTLLRYFAGLEHPDVALGAIERLRSNAGGLEHRILRAFGWSDRPASTAVDQQIAGFAESERGAGRHPVLIVDDAHEASDEELESLCRLQQWLSVILLGEDRLASRLRENELPLTRVFGLAPLSHEEVPRYVEHRLKIAGADREIFTRAACERIHELSGGVPRSVNVLCARSLRKAASVRADRVDASTVDAVAAIAPGAAPAFRSVGQGARPMAQTPHRGTAHLRAGAPTSLGKTADRQRLAARAGVIARNPRAGLAATALVCGATAASALVVSLPEDSFDRFGRGFARVVGFEPVAENLRLEEEPTGIERAKANRYAAVVRAGTATDPLPEPGEPLTAPVPNPASEDAWSEDNFVPSTSNEELFFATLPPSPIAEADEAMSLEDGTGERARVALAPVAPLKPAVREEPPEAPEDFGRSPAPAAASRVVIHHAAGDEDRARALLERLRRQGVTVELRQVPHAIKATHVRYFFEPDIEAARQVAGTISAVEGVSATFRDFTEYEPPPRRGTLELWLSN